MIIQNVIPRRGSNARAAFDAAVIDILKENPQNIKINRPVIVLPHSLVCLSQSLTFLSGKNGFIPSELNTGEGFVRKIFNN